MARFKYTLFYDFHTSTILPDVGENFDVERFTDNLKECGVDFLTWHARCNQGNAYYNTKFGYRHPSLKYDLFGEIARSCCKKGIRISAYFNGGLSDEELLHHRDWMRIAPDGHTMTEERPSAEMRATCYNSPYREHLKNMVRELAENYPVDGFFFDCMGSCYTCICPVCMKEMIERGVNFRDEKEIMEFTRFSILRLAKELHGVIRSVNPDGLFFLNGSLVDEMIGYDTHLECECLPSCTALGYDYLPVQAHYLRTVAQGNSVLCMTGRFYQWGDFGGLRKEEGIEYDLFYGMANGMRPEIGDHFHPRGDLYQEVFDLVKKIYRNLRQYDPWCLDAVNSPDIAIVFPKDGGTLRQDVSLKAAARMMTELKMQFNIVTEAAPWDSYRLLIFPDNVAFPEETTRRVKDHLARGGAVIASADSGLDPEGKRFVLPDWPAVYVGPTPHNPLYFAPEGDCAEGLPTFPLSVYASGTEVKAAEDAKVEMRVVKPYHNQEWDGFHSNWYTPPQEKTDEPFLVFKGRVAYCSGRLFEGYFKRSPYQSRWFLRNLLRRFVPNPKFQSSTLPSYARAFVQYNGNLELLHVMAYTPELRGESVALEERATLIDSELSLRIDGGEFRKVYLAPSRKELAFTVKDGYCTVHVPLIQGYALIVFEK
ncbi:MAG: Alpha-L-fucosidase [Lentisphaerae bacterium ADurb.Bin242]|nr:MAG: Alpha-L-fucosidase [Lentisphaerae bacterium ADurb.Bin242]